MVPDGPGEDLQLAGEDPLLGLGDLRVHEFIEDGRVLDLQAALTRFVVVVLATVGVPPVMATAPIPSLTSAGGAVPMVAGLG